MSKVTDVLSEKKPQIIWGAIGLLVMGVAGGSVAGFKVEPVECDECGKSLATCEAKLEGKDERLESMKERVSELKTVLDVLERECK